MLINTMLTGYEASSSNRNNNQIKRHCLSFQDDLEYCQDLLCLSPKCFKLHVNKSRRLAAFPVLVIVFPSFFAICSNALAETCKLYYGKLTISIHPCISPLQLCFHLQQYRNFHSSDWSLRKRQVMHFGQQST